MTLKNDLDFINDDFLLQNGTAIALYHDYAAKMPIIDYHNHLSPERIAKNEGFADITEAWLSEDHYKWRGMRANGIEEQYITGNASGKEKFLKWAETVPYTLKNPLFHWTHLELKRYFGIDELLQPENALAIYEETSAKLRNSTPQQLLSQMKVEVLCTTDDPTDTLQYHQQIASGDFQTQVLPTFRSDKLIHIESTDFPDYLEKLGVAARIRIIDLETLLEAIANRLDHFHALGCKGSDFGLTGALVYDTYTDKEVDDIVKKRIQGLPLSVPENAKYRSCLLEKLAMMYHDRSWAQQYHLGPIRNNNSKLLREVGADAGCDSIGDYSFATPLSKFFDSLNSKDKLAKTITYNLNPAYNEVFATMMGNFNTGGIPGKMQWGAAWWFLDQKGGMETQIGTLATMGLLSRFVGMLTDSRSFLSFPRHEYFRRILCNVIGQDVENGELPKDIHFLGKMIEAICYHNAKNYFGF